MVDVSSCLIWLAVLFLNTNPEFIVVQILNFYLFICLLVSKPSFMWVEANQGLPAHKIFRKASCWYTGCNKTLSVITTIYFRKNKVKKCGFEASWLSCGKFIFQGKTTLPFTDSEIITLFITKLFQVSYPATFRTYRKIYPFSQHIKL
jgi:hypothetical protein